MTTTQFDTLIRVSKMNGRKASADSTMTLTDQRSLISGELGRIDGRKGKEIEAKDQSGFTVLDSPDIEDFYFTPWDLGYGSYVKSDHDFIGREALEGMADDDHRHKVTLALDDEDVTRTIGTMFQKSDRAKYIDWPAAVYAMHQYDRVNVDGETVGVSTWIAYSANEGRMLTLAVLDAGQFCLAAGDREAAHRRYPPGFVRVRYTLSLHSPPM